MIAWFQPSHPRFMPHHFDAKAQKIDDLFGSIRPVLTVPQFQRGYSWEKKHVDAFWRDLTGFMQEKRAGISQKYFLGPIVILEHGDEKSIDILDGQQRLATITVLLAAMRNIANEIGSTEFSRLAEALHTQYIAKYDVGDLIGYSLVLGESDKDYFRDVVQEFDVSFDPSPSVPAHQRKPEQRSHRSIQRALNTLTANIHTAIDGLSNTEKMKWLREVRDTVRSDIIMTCIPVETEREAFQIFETLNDRGLRLSVPDLLLNYLMKIAPDKDRADIKAHWTDVVEQMGHRSTGQFLRHIWVSEFGDLKKQDLFSALKDHLAEKGTVSLEFARQCATQCVQYCQLLDADAKSLGKKFAKYVRHLLKYLDCDEALPLLLSSYLLSEKAREKVARMLLVFVTRYSVIAGMDAAEMETLLFSLARDVRAIMKRNEASRDVGERECLKLVKDELVKKNPSNEKIRVSMPELTVSTLEATYLLTKIAERAETDTREWGLNEANLEHIFPKKPSVKEWPNKDELESFLNHIGNLTMLGEPINNKISNNSFAFKRERYIQASEIVLTQEIGKKYMEWSSATVRERAKELGEKILEIWNMDNNSYV